jgi:hypothetical protein
MDPKNMDPSKTSTCTSCTYSEDFSNYWTASLYFRSPENGSYKMVPQMTNFRGLDGESHPQGGGITVYYMTAYGGSAKTTAFKPVSSAWRTSSYPLWLTFKGLPHDRGESGAPR